MEKVMPVDIANQVVYTLGQTDGHSSLDHATSQADIHTMEQNWIPSYPINGPQWPHRVCFGPL